MKKRYALFIIFVFAAFAAAQERFVRPVDEAAKNPSFLAFRTKLIAAAERKDSSFILSIVDPRIELSFGGDKGIADFKRIWKIDSKNSPFWSEFQTIIRNGGTFSGEGANRLNEFSAPYTFGTWPGDLDGFDYHVIFGNNVNLRKEPRSDAEIVAKLSYNVVKIEPETVPKSGKSEYPGWWEIRSLGGLKGYVKREFVRSPIDYRAFFTRVGGRWRLSMFVAGD